ncbi:MAG: PD-(D/E)XK nuclease family transposase [Clostridia bacterium]|nr:PD-(D/E)XK nuclease family transposase [Clostridia bacterium]
MREVFRNNLELAQFMLRIIIGKPDLVLTKEETQYDLQHLFGSRSITLDVFGEDSDGKQYDCEVQIADDGANAHRARYHSAAMDVDNLKTREDFRNLPDTYVIFITENDVWGEGKPIYLIERVNTTTGRHFNDGEHIIYVNGAYDNKDDTSDLAKLIHDFRCKKADEMVLSPFADIMKFLKETPKGVDRMCKVMEERVKDEKYQEKIFIAVNLLKRGKDTIEEIAELTGLSIEIVKQINEKLKGIPA